MAAVALPTGAALAFVARGGGLASVAPLGVAVRELEREAPRTASQAPDRSRAVAVARSGEGVAQGPALSRGLAIPREAWGGARARAGLARGGVEARQR
jgi:hypothetical protein